VSWCETCRVLYCVMCSEHDVVAWSRDQTLHMWTVNPSLRRVNNTAPTTLLIFCVLLPHVNLGAVRISDVVQSKCLWLDFCILLYFGCLQCFDALFWVCGFGKSF